MSSNHLLAATLILAAFATEVSAAPTKCRLLQLAERTAPPAGVDEKRLAALFDSIWRRARTSVWTCAELRDWGMLDATATRDMI